MKEIEVVVNLLRRNSSGLTITNLVSMSELSRYSIRVVLVKLENAKKVNVRKVGMAKVYTFID